jgi:Tfp pilus assembly protein PilW
MSYSPCVNRIRNRGFTLVEFLLYLAISSSVLLLAATFLGATLEAGVKNQTIAEVEQQGLLAMETMTRTIRNASSITAPTPGTSGATLTLVVPAVGDSPTVFTSSGDALFMEKGAAPPVALTNSYVVASALVFENLSSVGSPGSIRVSFTLTRTNVSGRFEYVYSKTFIGTASLRHP